MTTATLTAPLPSLATLRKEAAAAIERLIAFLDATEPDADAEPSLGYTDNAWQVEAQIGPGFHANADGGADLENDGHDLEPDTHDEASLGWTHNPNQGCDDWCAYGPRFGGIDLEDEHDGTEPDVDDEPSLGWTHTVNQTAPAWQANHLGMTDMEEGVGPVRKKRAASKTGGCDVYRGLAVLA